MLPTHSTRIAPWLLLALALGGCSKLSGGESAEAVAARKEAEGKAIGGACRHAGRAIEDCFALNKRADKSAVFVGWREMNDYMRDNKMDAVKPEQPAAPPVETAATKPEAAPTEEAPAPKKAAKAKKQES